MFKHILVGLLFCSTLLVFSQNSITELIDGTFNVRQIPGSEKDVKQFYSKLPSDIDTIYVNIFRPANCPRCDGYINSVTKAIKKYDNKPVVNLAVYADTIASRHYLITNGIKSDYILYDTDDTFNNYLSFSLGYLHVGYTLRISVKTGSVIAGFNNNLFDGKYAKSLSSYNTAMPQHSYRVNHKRDTKWKSQSRDQLKISSQKPIALAGSEPVLSEIIYQPAMLGTFLLVNDKLAMKAFIYDVSSSEAKLIRVLSPTAQQARTFVNTPDDVYNDMLKRNALKNIPLQPFFIDNERYGIAYSLPELWMESEDHLAYRNKPCLIEYSLRDTTISNVYALQYDYDENFYYPHFNMKPIGDNIVVGVQRLTWPIISDTSEFAGKPMLDPFMESFYSQYDQPTLAVFDKKSGKAVRRFGKLPELSLKTRTGYDYANTFFDSWNEDAVLVGEYSGEIIVSDTASLNCPDCAVRYQAFELDLDKLENPDTTAFYTLNYKLQTARTLNQRIVDIKIAPDAVHCIIASIPHDVVNCNKENYAYVRIDRSTGTRKEYAFPANTKSERRMGYGLGRDNDGNVAPFYLTSKNNKPYLVNLSVNK